MALIITIALIIFMVVTISAMCLQVKRSDRETRQLHALRLFNANPEFLK